MSSLTQVSIIARKVIRYGIYFIIFLMVGKIVLDTSIKIYRKFFPPPPPPPTLKYGKLPKISFPPSETRPNFNFTLETAEGDFPKLPAQAKVYFMPKVNPNLLSLDVSKEKAKALGFSPEAQQISETLYRFPHKTVPAALEMNIVSGAFSISYDLMADRSPLSRRPPASEIAASLVRSFLSSADILPADLTGPVTPEYLKLSQGKFVPALSLSEADLIKINFRRKDYDKLPSLTKDPIQSNIWFIVSGSQDKNQQVIAAEFHYYPVDETQFSTYTIKTPQQAFEELKGGGGYLASLGLNKEGENVKTRKIYLAYFDPDSPTEFFQPIYVFEGDKGFIAYLPAVTAEYYGD